MAWRGARAVVAAAAIRCVLALLAAVAADTALEDYDDSATVWLQAGAAGPPAGAAQTLAKALLRWDALYFASSGVRGYVYEQERAFGPGLPHAAAALAAGWRRLVRGPPLAPGDPASTVAVALAGIALANLAFVSAAFLLYRLSLAVLRDERRATVAALAFVLTPAGLFMTSMYTESPFACLAFLGMLLRERGRPWLAAATFGLAGLVRSNAILFAGFFAYDALVTLVPALAPAAQGKPRPSRQTAAVAVARAAALGVLSVAGFAWTQYDAYLAYCVAVPAAARRPWCDGPLPLLYTFVQRHYWNVGFLRYWELKQLPNFALAAPTLLLTAFGVAVHARAWLSERGRARMRDGTARGLERAQALPYVVLAAALAVQGIVGFHVQIVTRLFTALPAVAWAAAEAYVHAPAAARAWTVYAVGFGAASAVLFANFYPPA